MADAPGPSIVRQAPTARLVVMTAMLAALSVIAACSSDEGATGPSSIPGPASPTTEPTTTATDAPSSTTSAPATSAPPDTEPELASGPSTGCDNPARPIGDTFQTSDGQTRTLSIELPPGYDPNEPAPLVFDFHGLGSSGLQQSLVSLSPVAAAARGWILVVPDGSRDNVVSTSLWNLMPGPIMSTDPDAGQLAPDDLNYLTELLDALEGSLCVDTARVHAMGFSNGGFLSSVLACRLGDRLASVATVAGIARPEGCDLIRPVPLLHVHGTADQVVPFAGLASSIGADEPAIAGLDPEVVASFQAALDAPIVDQVAWWADANHCDPEPVRDAIGDHVEHRSFVGCEADVEFYVVDGGGHTWPGSLGTALIDDLGSTSFDFSATIAAFDFFERHPMPEQP